MCGSMVDIQSPTAEIRQEKKEERRRKKPQGKNIMACPITQGGHKKVCCVCRCRRCCSCDWSARCCHGR